MLNCAPVSPLPKSVHSDFLAQMWPLHSYYEPLNYMSYLSASKKGLIIWHRGRPCIAFARSLTYLSIFRNYSSTPSFEHIDLYKTSGVLLYAFQPHRFHLVMYLHRTHSHKYQLPCSDFDHIAQNLNQTLPLVDAHCPFRRSQFFHSSRHSKAEKHTYETAIFMHSHSGNTDRVFNPSYGSLWKDRMFTDFGANFRQSHHKSIHLAF